MQLSYYCNSHILLFAITLSDLHLDYKLLKAETIFHFPRNCYAILLHSINIGADF